MLQAVLVQAALVLYVFGALFATELTVYAEMRRPALMRSHEKDPPALVAFVCTVMLVLAWWGVLGVAMFYVLTGRRPPW